MVLKKQGSDIAQEAGGISSKDAARSLLHQRMSSASYSKIQRISNASALIKIANAVVLCQPDDIFINTGSEDDKQFIRDMAIKKGEEARLSIEKHTVHFDLKEEQGRIMDRTFYIADEDEVISSLANKMLRSDALKIIKEKMNGIMRGKIMIIGFYVRGPIGSPASNPAIEITSSAYVSHSAEILYRNIFSQFDEEVNRLGHFYANIHSEGLNRSEDLPDARVFMDRSYQTTYSFNCTYAGNTLLMKKGNHRFSVDKAVYKNRGKELSEHMFITGIEGPGGRITWCSGAAPSGCGKTTTAMAGAYFVGDDLAQMWINGRGSIRAVNPECGVFGILEDVNWEGDPHLMKLLRKPGTEVIWSNVLVDEKGVPHWTGNGEIKPEKGVNHQGHWEKGQKDENGKLIPVSHPNSRCTLSLGAFFNYSREAENPEGVEVRIITYSGRDNDTMPPVWAARTSDEGVVIGACIVSAATATEVGATGVKRAPWANAPFIPGALGDYMDAQFKFFGNPEIAEDKKPVIAGLNYFLTHEARGGRGKKLLGEKKDVRVWLAWLERRVNKEVGAIPTPIGYIPLYNDLENLFKTIIDKNYPKELYVKQFSLYLDKIISRVDLQISSYQKESNLPQKLFDILNKQKNSLMELKDGLGPIISPFQLLKATL